MSDTPQNEQDAPLGAEITATASDAAVGAAPAPARVGRSRGRPPAAQAAQNALTGNVGENAGDDLSDALADPAVLDDDAPPEKVAVVKPAGFTIADHLVAQAAYFALPQHKQ